MATAQQRSAAARIAVNTSWAKTPNRTERTSAGYKASPMSLDYHIAAVRAEGIVREEDVLKAAASRHRAYQQQMALRAAKARTEKKAERERLRRSA